MKTTKKIFNLLIAVSLLLNQTVFLFAPANVKATMDDKTHKDYVIDTTINEIDETANEMDNTTMSDTDTYSDVDTNSAHMDDSINAMDDTTVSDDYIDPDVHTDNVATMDDDSTYYADDTVYSDSATIDISFINVPASPISGDVKISVSVNAIPDNIYFNVQNSDFYKNYTASEDDSFHYYFTLPTKELVNGTYTIMAVASNNGIEFSNSFNSDIHNDLADIYDIDSIQDFIDEELGTEDNEQVDPLEITFIEALQPPVSGDVKISISANKELVSANFYIEGNGINKEYAGTPNNSTEYYFIWKTKELDNGYYEVTANVLDLENNKASKSFSVQVTNEDIEYEDMVSTEEMEITFVERLESPFQGDQKITVALSRPADTVYFKIEGAESKEYASIKNDDHHYYFIFPTEQFPDGYYELTAVVIQDSEEFYKSDKIEIKNEIIEEIEEIEEIDKITEECKNHGITDNLECENFMSMPVECRKMELSIKDCDILVNLSIECQERGIMTREECDKLMAIAPECRDKGIYDQAECNVLMMPQECKDMGISPDECDEYQAISPECRKEGIINNEKCREYMSISPECRWKGLTDEECDKYMRMPHECREANIIDHEMCKKYLQELFPPEVLPECEKHNMNTVEECNKFMMLAPECRDKQIFNFEECEKYIHTPPECREKGLSIRECDKYMRMPMECRQLNILDLEKCKKIMYEQSIPHECREANITDHQECNKFLFLKHVPWECREANVSSPEECEKLLREQMHLTEECRKANIMDPHQCDKYMVENRMMPHECQKLGAASMEECEHVLRDQFRDMDDLVEFEFEQVSEFEYFDDAQGFPPECMEQGIITAEECKKIMFKLHMPPECQKAGAATMEECDKIMFSMHMPIECKEANISDPKECDKYMMMAHMPIECHKENASSPKECEKIMFKKHAPKECLEAGAATPEECEKIMFKKHAPPDCKEAGIFTGEACKKYMFEKYGEADKIPMDQFPIECQKAGASTPEECEKIMKKLYMPMECQKQGITDDEKCKTYMQHKYMPQECREAQASSREECDEIMFKQYGPTECKEANISNEKECEEFMFNKYAPEIKCHGMDEWQCQNAIKERHLGNIIAKEAKFQEIKDQIGHLIGESLNVEDLEQMLEIAKEILPIRKQESKFKILSAKEESILDENENLIKTSPVALMLDSVGAI